MLNIDSFLAVLGALALCLDASFALLLPLQSLGLELSEAAALIDYVGKRLPAEVPFDFAGQLGLRDGLVRPVQEHEFGLQGVLSTVFALLQMAAAARVGVAEAVAPRGVGLAPLLGGLLPNAFRADLDGAPPILRAFFVGRLADSEHGLLDAFVAASIHALLRCHLLVGSP